MINWQSIKHTTFCQNTTYIIWLIAKYQSFPTSNSEKIIRGIYGDIFDDTPHVQVVGNKDDSSLLLLINYLNSLHSYLIHSGDSLFRICRLSKDENDTRFTTSATENIWSQNKELDIASEIELGEQIVIKIHTYHKRSIL